MAVSRDHALLSKEADALAWKAKELSANFQSPTPSSHEHSTPVFRLAHYTTLEAVISMLQSPEGGLRLSDSSTMNDPEEGCATRDGRSIRHLLDDEFEQDSWLRRRYDHAHICCFVGVDRGAEHDVEPGDDLLFWRLYGNECRGLSITLPPYLSTDLLRKGWVQQVTYAGDPPLAIDLRPISSLLHDLEKLRVRSIDAELWHSVYPVFLSHCDLVMAYRFLHKRAHYSMEREYRAVAFVTANDEAPEDGQFPARGHHVQYHRIRTYVQTPQLACRAILTTNSRITIGANVPESDRVKRNIADLVSRCLELAPGVVSVRLSRTQYRPR